MLQSFNRACIACVSTDWDLLLQILHTISNEQLELVNSMAPYMEKSVLPILKETKTLWQPADFLPESSSETFIDEVGFAQPY